MQIQKINIKQVLGIEELEIFPGKINKISAKNGVGKTSFIESLKTALGGGNDATLIHNGSEEGEVVILFDNNMHLRRRIRGPKNGILELHDSKGREVSAPQTELNNLFDAISVNPIEFINSKDKDRLELLLESLPLELDIQEVLKRIKTEGNILGLDPKELSEKLSEVYEQKYNNPMNFIDDIDKDLSDERRYLKRNLDSAKATIPTLEESIVELDVDEEETKKEIAEIEATLEKGLKRYEDSLGEISSDYNTRLDALNKEYEEKKEALDQALSDDKDRLRDRYDQAKSGYKERLTTLKSNLETAAGLLRTKEELDNQKKKAENLSSLWQDNNESIKSLREYKKSLLKDIPISDLELENGIIFRNGVSYSKLNKAQQLEIAIEVAILRTKEIGIICIDGIEILDTENQKQLFKKLESSNIQYFITEVTDDKQLKIEKQ